MKKDKIISQSLSKLIEKFSREDVVEEMEKAYQSAPAKIVSLSALDDVPFLKDALIPEETIDYFATQIKDKGLYNPLIVRSHKDRYEVILGRKRFHGALKAGLITVPVVIADFSDEEVLLILLADTRDQRKFNVVEMALICDQLQTLYGYTQQTLADLSFQSRSQITNTLRILKLPTYLRKEICLGKMSYGHAKAIASLDREQMDAIVRKIRDEHLSVRETEVLAKNYRDYGKSGAIERSLTLHVGAQAIVKKKSVSFLFNDEKERDEFINSLLLNSRPEVGVCKLEEKYNFSMGPYGQSKIATGLYQGQILSKSITNTEIGEYPLSFPIFPFRVSLISGDGIIYVDPDDGYAKRQYAGHFGGHKLWYVLSYEEGAQLRLGTTRSMFRDDFKSACKNDSAKSLLKAIKVKEGDHFEIPPKTIYCIDKGIEILEIKENSILSYPFIGKKSRLVDAAKSANYLPYIDSYESGEIYATSPNFTANYGNEKQSILATDKDSLGVLIILKGEGNLNETPFAKGDVFIIPANRETQLLSSNCSYLFVRAEKKVQMSLFG